MSELVLLVRAFIHHKLRESDCRHCASTFASLPFHDINSVPVVMKADAETCNFKCVVSRP